MSRKRMKLLSFRKVSRKDWLRYSGRKCIGRYFDYGLDSYTFPVYYISVYDLYRYKHVKEICRWFDRLHKNNERKRRRRINSKMKLSSI